MDDHSGCCCQVCVPYGNYQGWRLVEIIDLGESGLNWLAWAARRPFAYWPLWFSVALQDFIRTHDLQALSFDSFEAETS